MSLTNRISALCIVLALLGFTVCQTQKSGAGSGGDKGAQGDSVLQGDTTLQGDTLKADTIGTDTTKATTGTKGSATKSKSK